MTFSQSLIDIQTQTYRTSETIREDTLCVYQTTMHFNLNASLFNNSDRRSFNTSFLQWFVGFVEGDGSTKIYNNQFAFVIVQKELYILIKIRAILGFGKFSVRKDGYGTLRFTQKQSAELFLNVLWGNLITDKKQNDVKHYYEKLKRESPELIVDKTIDFNRSVFPSLETGWLAGIIDSDGGLSITSRKNRYSPRFRIYIDQNERAMLEKIAACLKKVHPAKGQIYESKESPGNYRLTYSSRDIINKIFLPYFNKFPLRTNNKKFRFILFSQILHKNLNLGISQIELKNDIKLFLKKTNKVEDIVQPPKKF